MRRLSFAILAVLLLSCAALEQEVHTVYLPSIQREYLPPVQSDLRGVGYVLREE